MNCIKKKKTEGYGEKPDSLLKWGIIVPHTRERQGATSFDGEVSEYMYGHRLAKLLSDFAPSATRDNDGIRGAVQSLRDLGCNASLEPHFNSYNGNVRGAEILCLKGDHTSAEFASLLIDDLKQTWPHRTIRRQNSGGIKWVAEGDRGFYNLYTARKLGMKVALLSELFFGDTPVDWMEPTDQAKLIKDLIINT